MNNDHFYFFYHTVSRRALTRALMDTVAWVMVTTTLEQNRTTSGEFRCAFGFSREERGAGRSVGIPERKTEWEVSDQRVVVWPSHGTKHSGRNIGNGGDRFSLRIAWMEFHFHASGGTGLLVPASRPKMGKDRSSISSDSKPLSTHEGIEIMALEDEGTHTNVVHVYNGSSSSRQTPSLPLSKDTVAPCDDNSPFRQCFKP